MRKKCLLCLLIFTIVTLFLFFVYDNRPDHNNDMSYSWVGTYSFYEYLPPNQNMDYSISLYDDDGLYAHIKIDGFHTLKRLKAKVWSNGEETMFVFCDYYTDEEGNSTIPETYNEGDILLKLKKQEDVLITEWGKLQPMLTENEEPGQYFIKSKK
ncbi:DUF5991 domain-containing protein [Lacrimispora brassicae]